MLELSIVPLRRGRSISSDVAHLVKIDVEGENPDAFTVEIHELPCPHCRARSARVASEWLVIREV